MTKNKPIKSHKNKYKCQEIPQQLELIQLYDIELIEPAKMELNEFLTAEEQIKIHNFMEQMLRKDPLNPATLTNINPEKPNTFTQKDLKDMNFQIIESEPRLRSIRFIDKDSTKNKAIYNYSKDHVRIIYYVVTKDMIVHIISCVEHSYFKAVTRFQNWIKTQK
jgi:hypothetical protein